jgi:ankyrin repeat protein
MSENGNIFVNVNYICSDGQTLLHKACKVGNLNLCRILVENGASQNVKSKQGWFPIHLASYHGHLDVVVFLLTENNFKPDSIIAVYDDDAAASYRNKYRVSPTTHVKNSKCEIQTESSNYRDITTNLDDSGCSEDNSDETSSDDESEEDSNDEQESEPNNSSLFFENKHDLLINFNENDLLFENLLDLKHLELTSEDFQF